MCHSLKRWPRDVIFSLSFPYALRVAINNTQQGKNHSIAKSVITREVCFDETSFFTPLAH